MKTSKRELIELRACKSGLDHFMKQTNNTDDAVDVASLVGDENTYSDILWLLNKKGLSNERRLRFACDCALINIELIKPYTDKYELIIGFLKNPGKNDVHAADAASYAADAARAADAVRAARAADAAYAAVNAAYAASYAAAYAVRAVRAVRAADAARAAEKSDNKGKVNALLIEMINEIE